MLHKLQPWIPSAFVFILTFLLFIHPLREFSHDLGIQLKFGEIIFTTHQVPQTNLLSYTYPTSPYGNHEWLVEVVFYLFNKSFGALALLVAIAMLASASITILFSFAARRFGIFSSFAAALLYLVTLFERLNLRPEIFSLFFLSIFMVILYKNREKPTRLIFLLPLIELLWVNMHLYFILGPVLIVLFLIDAITKRVAEPRSKLVITFMLTCLATLINPSGLSGALYPFHVFSNYGFAVTENQSLFTLLSLNQWFPWYPAFFLASGTLLLLLLIYRKQTMPIDWILFIIFTTSAFMAERTFSLFVYTTFILFSRLVSYVFSSVEKAFFHNASRRITAKVILSAFGAIYIIYLSTHNYGFGLSIWPAGEKGADFFTKENIQGPIFNNYDIGSYLDYRLYPRERVFVDGRPEAYPASFFQQVYNPMQQDPKVFEEVDKKYNFQAIFITYVDQALTTEQLILTTMQNLNWQLVYIDTYSAIWLKKDGVNHDIAVNHGLTQQNFSLPQGPELTPTHYWQLAHFLELVGWRSQMIQALDKVISLDPLNCEALGVLIQLPETVSKYSPRYQQYCH